jgi:hypothetical protein
MTYARTCFFALLVALPVLAQYSIGTIYRPLAVASPEGSNTCSRTWYDPDIFLLPGNRDLGVLAQSAAPSACTDLAIDSVRSARRNGGNGRWTLPGLADEVLTTCPTIQAQYTRCGFDNTVHAGPLASPSVVRLDNPNSPTGVRYYMAFVGGNADFIHGKVYWAVSDDAQSWHVYQRGAKEGWTPILQAKYLRADDAPRSAPACSQPSGIGQVQLAFEDGLFYVFLQYWHPVQPECAEGHDSAQCLASPMRIYDRAVSSMLYRFDYSPNHPDGFGPSVREIYVDGRWQRSSGKFVWRYDVDAVGLQLSPDPENPVLELFNGVLTAGFQFGAGDVKRGNDRWLHVSVFEDVMQAQTATSLDPTVATWTPPVIVDVGVVEASYPLYTNGPSPGIWYGSLSGTPEKWWIWVPVPTQEQRCRGSRGENPFAGLSLLPSVLCTPDGPC